MNLRIWRLCVPTALSLGLVSIAALADSQAPIRFSLPSEPLAESLRAIASQTNSNILFDQNTVRGLSAVAVQAELTLEEALRRVLAGTGLTFRMSDSKTVIIEHASLAASAHNTVDTTGANTDPTPHETDGSDQPSPEAGGSSDELQEVVVTARRKQELLQDVPQTVNALSAQTIENLALRNVADLTSIVPGLSINGGGATLRGVGYIVNTQTPPTVEFYLNDAPVQADILIAGQNLFDISQIEVLRGPQGTLHGRASPSGSITFTTHQPDLTQIGGYMEVTGTDQRELNGQFAFNLPIVNDVLAVRIAGLVDTNDFGGSVGTKGRSINSDLDSTTHTYGLRGSVLFRPTDSLSAQLTYQHLSSEFNSFPQVESFGYAQPGVPLVAPIIAADQYLGIVPQPTASSENFDIVNGQFDWRFSGQKLSYVGSYSHQYALGLSDADAAAVFPSTNIQAGDAITLPQSSQEIRLSSDERLFKYFDYTVGFFYNWTHNRVLDPITTAIAAREGPALALLDVLYPVTFHQDRTQREKSVFGNLTIHLTDRTELAGGVRHIFYADSNRQMIEGAENLTLDGGKKVTFSPTIFQASLSQHLTDDVMAYFSVGSSWREGAYATGLFRPLTPRLQEFSDTPPETSTSYEIGIKSDWFDKRLRVNLDGFVQNFTNYVYSGPSVYYVNIAGNGVPGPSTFNFIDPVKVDVKGIEAEVDAVPTARLDIYGNFAWAQSQIKNSYIACNAFSGTTVPTVAQIQTAAGGEAVAQCLVNGVPISSSPKWNLSLTSDYHQPINDQLAAFIRGQFTYTPSFSEGVTNPYNNIASYGIFNLYAGLRRPDSAWEATVYAKNLFNVFRVTRVNNALASTSYELASASGVTGTASTAPYVGVNSLLAREVGIRLRYAFGSR